MVNLTVDYFEGMSKRNPLMTSEDLLEVILFKGCEHKIPLIEGGKIIRDEIYLPSREQTKEPGDKIIGYSAGGQFHPANSSKGSILYLSHNASSFAFWNVWVDERAIHTLRVNRNGITRVFQ